MLVHGGVQGRESPRGLHRREGARRADERPCCGRSKPKAHARPEHGGDGFEGGLQPVLTVAQVVVNDGRVRPGETFQEAQATPFRRNAVTGGEAAEPPEVLIRRIKRQRQVPLSHVEPVTPGIVEETVEGTLCLRLLACREIGAE